MIQHINREPMNQWKYEFLQGTDMRMSIEEFNKKLQPVIIRSNKSLDEVFISINLNKNYPSVSLSWEQMETEEERDKRVERQLISYKHLEKYRREQYERLKKEFEPGDEI